MKSQLGSWEKKVPGPDGSYWCRWKGKHGWATTIATVTTLGPYGPATDPQRYDKRGRSKYDRIIKVDRAGTFTIGKGYTEREARKAYGYTEALFWSEAIKMPGPPPPPKSHRRKSKAK